MGSSPRVTLPLTCALSAAPLAAATCGVTFFSSRRRHTKFDCDWSSDVCSSDLPRPLPQELRFPLLPSWTEKICRKSWCREQIPQALEEKNLMVQCYMTLLFRRRSLRYQPLLQPRGLSLGVEPESSRRSPNETVF